MNASVPRQLLAVVFLSGRPQDLPASRSVLATLAVLSVVTGYLVDRAHDDEAMRLLFALTQTVLLGAWVWLALYVRGYPARWIQTMSALYGSALFLNLVTWPLFVWLEASQSGTPLPLFFALVMTLWFLAIMTQVLRHALVLPAVLSALVSFGLLVINGWILVSLFPLSSI